MKLLKNIFIILLLIITQINSFPVVSVYAQDATISAQEATSSSEILDSLDNIESLTATSSALDVTTEALSSAQVKLPPSVRTLVKKNYKAGEKLIVVINNADASDYKVSLFNYDGNETPVKIEKVNDFNPAIFRITPPSQFKAGRYRLVVRDSSGNVSSTQDFTWGVLAINPNKSIYLPNEIAQLAMAVLDETGKMICDAELELRIKNQELSIDDVLSTENGKIQVNPECHIKDLVHKADYEATYQVGGAEGYSMTLTAETKNGIYTINDSFEVRESVAFDIERVMATRLYPPITYPAVFNITASEDFEGVVKETVPGDFAITQLDEVRPFDSIEQIFESSPSAKPLEASIFGLAPPFDNTHPISNRFGKELNDPILKVKYSDYGVLGHDGVDFDMEEGTPVLAVDDGEVVKAAANGDYGTTVVIQHDWGKSYYGHLSKVLTEVGQKVSKADKLALSGNTGLSTGAHLHFGIKPNSNDTANGYYGKIDPLPYISLKQGNSETQTIASLDSTLQVVSWNISLKKGETVQLGYNFQVPNISPQFYLVGPLKFTGNPADSSNLIFQEARQWQLAVDVVATLFMESGTDATQAFQFFGTTGGTVTSDTAQARSGPRSIKADTTSVATSASVSGPANAGANGRTSFGVRITNLPDANAMVWLVDGNSGAFRLKITSAGKLMLTNTNGVDGDQIGSNSTITLSTDTWYRVSVAWKITSTTVYEVRVFVDGTQEITGSNSPTLITATPTTNVWLYAVAAGANKVLHLDDIYTDDSDALTDTGNIRVTYKAPGTVTNNNFDTTTGTGVVDERPISTTNGKRHNATSDVEQSYAIQAAGAGDVDISTDTLVARTAFIWAERGGGNGTPVADIVNNAVLTAITLTTTAKLFTNIVDSTTYPTDTRTIGMTSTVTAQDSLLHEAGMLFASIPGSASPTNDQLMRHGNWFSSNVEQPFTF